MLSGIINAACEGSPARLPGSGPINDALAATTGVGARDEIEGMPLPALAGLGWPLIIPPCISATISDDRFALDRDPEIPLWQHADVRPLELGFSRKLDGDGAGWGEVALETGENLIERAKAGGEQTTAGADLAACLSAIRQVRRAGRAPDCRAARSTWPRSEALSGTGTVMGAKKSVSKRWLIFRVPMVRIRFPPARSLLQT
jgi:hypothetical protein